MVAKIRAERKDDEFQKLDQEVEDIVNAVLKVCREARRDPDKWKPYDITDLNRLIYGEYHSNYSNGRVNVTSQDGVLSLYDKFVRDYMSVKKGETSRYSYSTDLQNMVDQIRRRIETVRSYMAHRNML